MARALPEENPFRAEISKLCWLEAYATAYRYPRTKGTIVAEPARSKLEAALPAIRDILEKIAEHFGVDDLDTLDDIPAEHAHPPRATNLQNSPK
jgi:hypothetical protein